MPVNPSLDPRIWDIWLVRGKGDHCRGAVPSGNGGRLLQILLAQARAKPHHTSRPSPARPLRGFLELLNAVMLLALPEGRQATCEALSRLAQRRWPTLTRAHTADSASPSLPVSVIFFFALPLPGCFRSVPEPGCVACGRRDADQAAADAAVVDAAR